MHSQRGLLERAQGAAHARRVRAHMHNLHAATNAARRPQPGDRQMNTACASAAVPLKGKDSKYCHPVVRDRQEQPSSSSRHLLGCMHAAQTQPLRPPPPPPPCCEPSCKQQPAGTGPLEPGKSSDCRQINSKRSASAQIHRRSTRPAPYLAVACLDAPIHHPSHKNCVMCLPLVAINMME